MTGLHPIMEGAIAPFLPPAGVRPARIRPASFEAFNLAGPAEKFPRTALLDPLAADTLKEAVAEAVGRWSWDRGDRLGIREIGDQADRLHIYAVRRKSIGQRVWSDYRSSVEFDRWLDHICTLDLNVVAGIAVGAVGTEIDLHERRQEKRPEGARMVRS